MLIIRKYPNRRLYDTERSSYITLNDIRQLVIDHVDFKVVDSKSDEDLTQQVLLQIIAEQESREGQSLLSANVLRQLIRFSGSGMQGLFSEYMEQSVAAFLEQQETLQGVVRNMMENSPFAIMSRLVDTNLEAWKSFSHVLQRGGKKSEE